jgi:hypothetical protein
MVVSVALLASCARVSGDGTSGTSQPPGTSASAASSGSPVTGGEPGAFLLLVAPAVPDAALVNPDPDGIAAEVNWRDSLGDHRVVLRKEVDYVSADPADGVARVRLTARHYLLPAGGGDVVLAGEVETGSPPCPDGDIADDVWPDTLSASDADGDGVGEATFILTGGCVTDASADVTAYAMTGDAVYTVSGPRPVPGEAGTGRGPLTVYTASPVMAYAVTSAVDPVPPDDPLGQRLTALWGSPLARAATAVDWRDGSPGIRSADSRILAEYGETGPQTALPSNAGIPGTAGSGCVVPPGETLPDGVWAGYLNASDAAEAAFDVICFLTVPAAREAGVDDSFVGFTFEDDSEGQRPVPWDEGAAVHVQTNPPVRPVTEDTETVSLAAGDADRVQAYLREFPRPFGWLLVEGGRAVEFWSPPLAGG